jgi:hypothetical protein
MGRGRVTLGCGAVALSVLAEICVDGMRGIAGSDTAPRPTYGKDLVPSSVGKMLGPWGVAPLRAWSITARSWRSSFLTGFDTLQTAGRDNRCS